MTTRSDERDRAPSLESNPWARIIPEELERLARSMFSAVPSEATPAVPNAVDAPRSADPSQAGAFVQRAGNVAPTPLAPPPTTNVGPIAPVPPPRVGPSALNVGAGGFSPMLSAPPVPGFMHQLPPASAPLPRESDLRGLGAVYAENVHGTSVIPLLSALESPRDANAGPYFLQIAGMPGAAPSAPSPNFPSTPTFEPALAGASGASGASGATSSSSGLTIPSHALSVPTPGLPDVESITTSVAPAHPSTASTFSPNGGSSRPAESRVHGSELPWSGPTTRGPSGTAMPVSPKFAAYDAGLPSRADVPNQIASGYVPDLASVPTSSPRLFDPHSIKRDFPILRERVHGRPLVWLDNGATTQKPQVVIDRLSYFYEHENSNIHRAAHTLAARSTDAYEAAREKVQRFVKARSPSEVIFVRGTTEGINLVSQSWGRSNIGPGDEIVITWLEHHANIVPWQQLAREKGAVLRVVPVDESGQVDLAAYQRLLGPRTKLVSITHVSNALGTIVPVREMVQLAKRHGATTLVDGAQAVSHARVDVAQIDCDFYVFSGHKIFAPTGIGAVIGKREVLERMAPWQGGGNMIQDVTFEHTTFAPPPGRFEAGTGNIADAVGLGAALDYVDSLGIDNISHYEHQLLEYGTERLRAIPGLRMIGTAADKAGVMSFVLDGVPTEEVGSALDRDGIAVRAGHHCAQPILRRFGVEATVRATLAPYNTREDLDLLAESVRRIAGEKRARR